MCPPLPGPVGSVATVVDVIGLVDDSMVSDVELGPWDVQVLLDHDVGGLVDR